MAPSATDGVDNSSPSASSLFLPLGKRARRDSKSSLSNEMDQDALTQALNTIHSAASQSQVLTVFNEYTDPPSSSSKADSKGLASDIQGGFSGLYNKLKASVAAPIKDPLESKDPTSPANQTHERTVSKASSGIASAVHSPRAPGFDVSESYEGVSSSSKRASKAFPAGAKPALSTIPLKSPTIPAQTALYVADPSVTEVNIQAAANSAAHSRTASALESSHAAPPLTQDDDLKLHKSTTRRTLRDDNSSVSDKHVLTSPTLLPDVLAKDKLLPSHVRTGSEVSSMSATSARAAARAEAPMNHLEEQSFPAFDSGRQERAPPRAARPSPLELLGDRSKSPTNLKPKSTTNSEKPRKSRPSNQLQTAPTHSRLPGFATSRTSSPDSGLTAALSSASQPISGLRMDGSKDAGSHNASRAARKVRSRLLNREFWMRDENARDCFHCGEPFTTFRRKHHCRTCGQIFDNKCTVTIKGYPFGSTAEVRVCKPCEAIIASHDDSSDYSDEGSILLPETGTRPRTPDTAQLLRSAARLDDDNVSIMSQSLEHVAKTPTMNFPVRRAYEGDRSSRVLEFDSIDRPLPRPSSSRSLKGSHPIGHKRHHSRHQHIRSHKSYHDERAPFQRRTLEDALKEGKASAFHRDSIIDPDLAQYLSDDASSGEEQSLSMALQPEKQPRPPGDPDRSAIGGLLAAVRKGRSRIGDRSIAGFLNIGRENDDAASIVSSRAIDGPRPPRRRNLSAASSIHQRMTPRTTKERLQFALGGLDDSPLSAASPQFSRVSRMIRSASMHGISAPAMELNRASIQHVHKLILQLLRDAELPKVTSWEEALIPILLRATDDVDPDVQNGDDLDIRNYVKLKKVPGGKPGDTAYISGLIFTKNVALKSMARLVMQPRILVITFALEYSRHEQHFMSLDPVIRQEREYLENLVGRIATLKPDVLFAQKNISGLALELLVKANVATVFNVKPSVLEAISRCTQTRVVHSIDKLSSQNGQLGSCDSFEVKTYVSEGKKKTYIYLSGCPPELGCTVAIRGGDRRTLAKIKRITEFMIYVVYNLKLETCLMRDEWALIPTSPPVDVESVKQSRLKDSSTISSHASKDESLQTSSETPGAKTEASSIEAQDSFKSASAEASTTLTSPDIAEIPDDIPVPTFYEDLVDKHVTKILSASPFVKFSQPYLLMRARELERRVAYLRRLRDQDLSLERALDDKSKTQKFTLIKPEMLHAPPAGASKKVREIIHAVHDTEYDKALHNYETQKKQWEAYLSGNRNLFDPYAHQHIVVLFSHVATTTSVPCSGPDLLAFSFYNEHEQNDQFEADCTLGQYVEDLCYRANDSCTSDSCEKKMFEHHRQYVHGEAQITVFVLPFPAKMRGLQDVILMWSQCKICGVETTVTPMSPSTWKYSFGKYLELSFWSSDLHARAGICPHDLHRDHLRYFGYKDFALRVHYDPIDLLEIIVPRMRITWKVDNDLRFRNDVYAKIEHRITRFMGSVKLRLKSINVDALLPETIESCRAEIERLTKKATEEHTTLIKQLQDRYTNSHHWEIIPLYKAMRATQEKVAEWDIAFAEFEQNFFPSEKDIRRLATLQLKKIFLDRDVSVTSVASDHDGTVTPPIEEVIDEKATDGDTEGAQRPMKRRLTTLSPEKTQSVLQSVLEEHASPPQSEAKPQESDDLNEKAPELPILPDDLVHSDAVDHLDLAVSQAQLPHSAPIPIYPRAATPSSSIVGQDEPATPKATNIVAAAASMDATPRPRLTESTSTAASQLNPNLKITSPSLVRTRSQPVGSIVLHNTGTDVSHITSAASEASHNSTTQKVPQDPTVQKNAPASDRKFSDRIGLSQLKNSKFVKGHSLIPRAISNRKESRVSNLAKHFEQLSREFERERIREKKVRQARNRQARVYPLVAPKPIVEVYRDVDEAVDEPISSDDIFDLEATKITNIEEEDTSVAQEYKNADTSHSKEEGIDAHDTPADTTETEGDLQLSSHAPSEVGDASDIDDDGDDIHLPESPEDLLRLSQEDIDLKELPKHERSSLMKMLTNFWAERSSSGWTPLEYPMGATEHVFADCDIIVREDEPSSIVAFALASHDYKGMLRDIQEHAPPVDNHVFGHDHPDSGDLQADVMHSLLRKTGTHLKYQFQEGPAKMLCKIFFAEQFDAVRRKCGVADRIIESLSRCLKWDSKGGKTKSLFLKTLDDRFVLKSLSPVETQSFLNFAPNYFQIMSEAFFHELPSVIAKMLGFYQIIIKNPVTGVEYNWYLLLMENLFYDRTPTRIFDLKGSMRNRKITATGERNEVLLDENMVEFIYESPLFAREHSKKLLRSSVHNDTLFLARQNVMDYSLMIALDENKKDKELVVGIIDCIRTYTWDKKLESWIKDRGFANLSLGAMGMGMGMGTSGGKNRPTVTSPKEYKRRFREAMGRYVLEAPSCWHQIRVRGGQRRFSDEGERERERREDKVVMADEEADENDGEAAMKVLQ